MTLKHTYYISWGNIWLKTDHHVYVIWHNFHCLNGNVAESGLFHEDIFHLLYKLWRGKSFLPVLRTPNEMEVKECAKSKIELEELVKKSK